MDMAHTEIRVEVNPKTAQVFRYHWDEIKEPGETVYFTGIPQPLTAQQLAYRYAKRRGWKITTRIWNASTLIVTRLS